MQSVLTIKLKLFKHTALTLISGNIPKLAKMNDS